MAGQSVESRVESLERRVTDLEGSQQPLDGLATQILQLRTEMREGFSAIREEFHRDLAALGNQMRVLHEDVIARLTLTHEGGAGEHASRKARRRRGGKG